MSAGKAGSAPRFRLRLPRGLAAFEHRNYRLFYFGQLISVSGTWMQTLAQSWLVLTLTSSAFQLGLVNVFQFAPVLVFGLMGGVLADRFPKRSLLVVTQGTACLLASVMALLVWTNQVQLWQVYVLAFGLGVVNAVDMPTRQSFVVEMVGRDHLMNAIALNSTLFNAARVIGPAIAGLLLATVGVAVCFAINAASYLAVISGLLLMRLAPPPERSTERVITRLREGLRYVQQTPDIFLPIILIGAVATFGMNFNIWVPLLSKQDLGVGAAGFGVMMSALGVGSLGGALGLAFLGRLPTMRLLLGAALALGLVEVALAVTARALPLLGIMGMLAGLGCLMTTMMAMANTRVQSTARDALRGRVMSVYMTVFAGTAPFGALVAGAVANTHGATGSLMVGGVITVISAFLVALLSRRVVAGPVRSASTAADHEARQTNQSPSRP
ncbi:MAG: MFS transporter [Chloroflexota bacterium]|nr:MFS transporter [Chloroflexota bacterium]